MTDFANAVALITGAASGIGAATAARLASGGAKKLILVDTDEEKLRDHAFTLPCERQPIVGDVADPELWAAADLTGLTHAVVNAGTGGGAPTPGSSFEDGRRVLPVNRGGAFPPPRAAMRGLRARGGPTALPASVAGLKAEPNIAAY